MIQFYLCLFFSFFRATSALTQVNDWCFDAFDYRPCNGAAGQCVLNWDGSMGGFIAYSARVPHQIKGDGAPILQGVWLGRYAQICEQASLSGTAHMNYIPPS